ncbi:hypothetical protein BGZ65_006357, partial [Modicella reniformis]
MNINRDNTSISNIVDSLQIVEINEDDQALVTQSQGLLSEAQISYHANLRSITYRSDAVAQVSRNLTWSSNQPIESSVSLQEQLQELQQRIDDIQQTTQKTSQQTHLTIDSMFEQVQQRDQQIHQKIDSMHEEVQQTYQQQQKQIDDIIQQGHQMLQHMPEMDHDTRQEIPLHQQTCNEIRQYLKGITNFSNDSTLLFGFGLISLITAICWMQYSTMEVKQLGNINPNDHIHQSLYNQLTMKNIQEGANDDQQVRVLQHYNSQQMHQMFDDIIVRLQQEDQQTDLLQKQMEDILQKIQQTDQQQKQIDDIIQQGHQMLQQLRETGQDPRQYLKGITDF